MAYQTSRGVAWIDRATKKLTETPDGADRLSRWLVFGFTTLMLSLALMGLVMAVYGSDRGSLVAFFGMMGGLFVRLAFQRGIHFGGGTDERERLLAWKSMAVASGIVCCLLIFWMLANGAYDGVQLWVPETAKQWHALAFASLASVQGLASMVVVLLQPPYLPDADEEFGV